MVNAPLAPAALPHRLPSCLQLQVPLLATCRVVQRLLEVERVRAAHWQERALVAEAALAGGEVEMEEACGSEEEEAQAPTAGNAAAKVARITPGKAMRATEA